MRQLLSALTRWAILLAAVAFVLCLWNFWVNYSANSDPWTTAGLTVVTIGLIAMVDTLWLRGRRMAAAAVYLLLFPVVLSLGTLAIYRKNLHWPLDELHSRAAKGDSLLLADLVDGWSQVCIATPYCQSGVCPSCDISDDPVCGDTPDGGSGGIVFLRNASRLAIQRVQLSAESGNVWLNNTPSPSRGTTCFAVEERPALFAGPDRSLLIRATDR